MKLKLVACLTLTVVATSGAVHAQDEGASEQEVQEPVVISDYQPPGSQEQIVIRPGKDDAVFYEYRVNGELVEIKVVPKVGPEYYLVPADGGGWIRETETELLVPSWVLFRW